MHETAQHSTVSEALATLACGPLDATSATAVDHARARLAEARAHVDDAIAAQLGALLQSQGSSAGDLRVRAWTMGAVLAQVDATHNVAVLAAVMTIGDALDTPELEMAQAAAVGIEAAARLLGAVDSDAFRARWNVASAIGVLGAVLAAARLYRLDETCARHALGIAATQAAGLAHNVTHDMGALETGKAVADAIEAALIAKHGFTSAQASIDGRRGLAALMAYRFDAASIVDMIGRRWVSAR
ncbi:hypothetical protein CFB89_24090 [Burkholderia sp. AU16741]|uniref:MmgE/PrpD family protein n=1 Tax=Burkholderia sp. AU16741 TaxID=2015347 RepID=UPI000B79DBDB|nr:MmgE/PrpD family protein [Burkholderia sp. AU16741]OXI30273.1 hypothetical protein CFB89_24090 [Burkholderia sp. AU16741]